MKTLNSKYLVATGIISWETTERQSQRYGSILVTSKSFNGSGTAEPTAHLNRLKRLYGARVHLNCRVLVSRKSDHLGDAFLGITPTQPEVGEIISLGVGFLTKEKLSWTNDLCLGLKPNDSRSKFWMDPRKLYRLHDQTVEVYAEPTSLPFNDITDISPIHEDGLIHFEDGSFAVAGVQPNTNYKIPMKVESMGDGMFVLSHNTDKFIPLNKLNKVK